MKKEITTKYKTPSKAAADLVQKINIAIAGVGTVTHLEKNGEHYINFENVGAFDAALGFVDGTGILGYEGFGPMGCYFAEKNTIEIECVNSCLARIF